MEQTLLKQTAQRLIKIRTDVLRRYPFYGKLLMRLPFGFAPCGTAFTDMHRIVFDPEFAARLDDTQLCFVMLHELMHCVLKHCIRGRGKMHLLYNIACDIVVNSIVLEAMQLTELVLDDCEIMHIAPSGAAGKVCSAEEIYESLIRMADDALIRAYGASLFDSHDVWEKIAGDTLAESVWDTYIKKSGCQAGCGSGIPDALERHMLEIYRTPKISWKQILQDYIRNDRCDYTFSKPDKRYSDNFILPSFQEELEGERLENVCFFVDTSGSVSDAAIAEAFAEIKDALEQVEHMTGTVLFFDTEVSEAFAFESVEDISRITPIGGGGTSFHPIFECIASRDEEHLPSVVIVITDGYAAFPESDVARGIPVIWLIVDSDVEAPWGECVHVYSDNA